jgi:hypothetical protein
MWNEGALKAINDSLGTFIIVDHQPLRAPARKVGKILVDIDIHGCLPKVLEVEWHFRRLLQGLDYMGIPFHCSLCHCTGHLCRDSNGPMIVQDANDFQSVWNVPDYSPTMNIFGSGNLHYPPEMESQFQPLDTLLGKLKSFCPTLYNSLTSWEQEALDSSGWLKHTTTREYLPSVVDKSLSASVTKKCSSQESNVLKQSKIALTTTSSLDFPFTLLLDSVPCLVSFPNGLEQSHVNVAFSLPFSMLDATVVIPNCRESEENDSSLSVVLDSLLPFIRDHKSIVPLPVYVTHPGHPQARVRHLQSHPGT